MDNTLDSPAAGTTAGGGNAALNDMLRGVTNWDFWLTLAWVDIKGRYRRTLLGPFWSVLNSLLFVLVLASVYSLLWRIDLATFLPFLTAGYFTWTFFAACIAESASCLYAAGETLKTMPVSPMALLMRVIARNLMVFAHNLAIFICIALVFGVPLHMVLLVIPGILILALTCLGVGTAIAFLCSRFRDFEQIVQSVLQILFFVSPILWQSRLLPAGSAALADYNPVFHLLRIVRDPLLGSAPPLGSYLAALLIMILSLLIGSAAYLKFRDQLAYWL